MQPNEKPPEWLEHSYMGLWEDMRSRLVKMGKLEAVDSAMLAAYVHCTGQALNAKRRGDSEQAALWKRGAQFAANEMGIYSAVRIDFLELLCDDHSGEVTYHLEPAWEI